jgi:hypothetical protein
LALTRAAQLAPPEVPSVLRQPAAERSVPLDAVPEESAVQQLRAEQALAGLVPCTPAMAHAAAEPQVWEAQSSEVEAQLAFPQPAV